MSAAGHLVGRALPALMMRSTAGGVVTLTDRGEARTVLYLYPMTGRPGVPLPNGWDLIPGARGCTAEACAFRDLHADLLAAGADVYGLSSQSAEYQKEAVTRLHLPFPLLSDEGLTLAEALSLPTFTAGGMRLFARLTMIVTAGVIDHVFYPVPLPERHAEDVLSWLRPARDGRFA
jgi:peroxiredoxin